MSTILVCVFVLSAPGWLAAAVPSAAQTTLGTIRGTVVDPQQNIVPGATVVVTDEATNVTREALTDEQGLFEISNLRSGIYTVTATLSGFKKAERTGVVLRAASIVRTDIALEVGGLQEVVSVTVEGQNNITLESQAIARGLDEQQLRDLPRNSRDIQDFLTLNPNIVGGFDGIQFLGGRTSGALISRTVSRRVPASSASFPMPPRGWTRFRRCRCCPTRTAPSTAALPVSLCRPSAGPIAFAAPGSTTRTS